MTITQPAVGEAPQTAAASGDLRVLFCIGVLPEFYAQPAAEFDRLLEPFGTAFNDLGARFGLRVLGTLDDVHFQSGPSFGYPWTCYILAIAPHHHAVQQVVGQLMDVEIAGSRLWRYAKIEARVGPPLNFGTS
jgi:hypothetical protein